MAYKLSVYRDGQRLVPASHLDAMDLDEVPGGKIFEASLSRPGYTQMRRFYNGLLRKFAEGSGLHKDELEFRLKVALGWANIEPYEGMLAIREKSLSGDALTPAYVDRAIDVLIEKYGAHIRRGDLVNEIERMIKVRL